jgi:septal ring factor EnvC (AmiA/AmiB activator)
MRREFFMSQSFWESEAVEIEEVHREQSQEPPAGATALALSVDDFSALEERILRAVELVKKERHARTEADERASRFESQLHEQTELNGQIETELNTLRAERDHVRQRVERLLAQLDALEI